MHDGDIEALGRAIHETIAAMQAEEDRKRLAALQTSAEAYVLDETVQRCLPWWRRQARWRRPLATVLVGIGLGVLIGLVVT